jgi:hypothetical protein
VAEDGVGGAAAFGGGVGGVEEVAEVGDGGGGVEAGSEAGEGLGEVFEGSDLGLGFFGVPPVEELEETEAAGGGEVEGSAGMVQDVLKSDVHGGSLAVSGGVSMGEWARE